MGGANPRRAGITVWIERTTKVRPSRIWGPRAAMKHPPESDRTDEPAIDRLSYQTRHNVPLILIDRVLIRIRFRERAASTHHAHAIHDAHAF